MKAVAVGSSLNMWGFQLQLFFQTAKNVWSCKKGEFGRAFGTILIRGKLMMMFWESRRYD